jgi:preprotein translocase subunit SecG
METALYILHVLVCLAMLPIILLQSGKGGGVSAVFGGGGSGTVFGSRGASNFLTKMTTGAAIVFMCTSMGLSYISSQSRSVVPATPDLPEQRPGGGLADEPVDNTLQDQVERPEAASEPGDQPLEIEVGGPSEGGDQPIQIEIGDPPPEGGASE